MRENNGKITFVTVSYNKDVERFSLLRESIRHFYSGTARHIVIVPRRDIELFIKIVRYDQDVEILAQEDYVAEYFYPRKWYSVLQKIMPGAMWRFKKYAGVRGWILQQPIKLSISQIISDGIAVILDSDVVFLHPFCDKDFGLVPHENRVLLRIEQEMHRKQMEVACNLLRLPYRRKGYHYTTMPMIMYSDWIAMLQQHIQSIHNKDWQKVLYETGAIHEDCVYGVFVEEILEPSNLNICNHHLSYMVWDDYSFNRFISGEWESMRPNPNIEPICAVIQSNLDVSVSEYRNVIEHYWEVRN